LTEALAPGAVLLHRYCVPFETALLADLRRVIDEAPLRQMITPGGFRMSVAMTSCGDVGWVTDRRGYRYSEVDPESGQPWPSMPDSFVALAASAARDAGFDGFGPDSCLVNRYEVGAKMSLHQDKDEADFTAPIVSVSLGLPATFLFGGPKRSDPTQKVPLEHGDVVVWGGSSRLFYHGVSPVKAGHHPLLGNCRINLTFRKAR
jgi:alkylated DNA repair protein (DNA oxidative demethylase)